MFCIITTPENPCGCLCPGMEECSYGMILKGFGRTRPIFEALTRCGHEASLESTQFLFDEEEIVGILALACVS